MPSYSLRTIKTLFNRAGLVCAFPDCKEKIIRDDGLIGGEICHIRARQPRGPRYDASQSGAERDGHENLIILCHPHHVTVDNQQNIYTVDILLEMKAVAERRHCRPEQPTDTLHAKMLIEHAKATSVAALHSNVAINSPNSVQNNVVNIRTATSKVKVVPPSDTIGAHSREASYVEHLISRYNDYAGKDRTRSRDFHPGVISRNISTKFGTSWRLVSLNRFDELCAYLQDRISRTIVGKVNRAKGQKLFSSYAEYLAKYRR